jgi:hypothetical protein
MRFDFNFVKRKAMNKFLMFACSSLLVVSCTIQKRLHNPGWNVQWNKNYQTSKSSDNHTASTAQFNSSVASDVFVEDEEEMYKDVELIDEKTEEQSQIEAEDDQFVPLKSTYHSVDLTKMTFNNNGLTLSISDKQKNDQSESQSMRRGKIDADMVYFILLILGVLVLLGLLLFSSGIWLKIAVVVLCLVLLALLIAAVVVIAEVFDFLFFGWWLG